MDYGDVDLIFIGKIETWEDIKNDIPLQLPVIKFPNYKGFSIVDRGEEWFDFLGKYNSMKNPNIPKLSDLWTIIFTSGTTGNPKGVKLSYFAIDETKNITEKENPLKVDFSGNNSFISYLPLNHIAERVVVEHVCLRFGGSLSFVESIDSFAKNLRDIQPHIFFAAPRIWTKFQLGILGKLSQNKLDILTKIPIISGIIKNKLKKGLGLNRARSTVSGSAPLSISTIEWFRKVGIYITNGYGMTENCAICSQVDGRNFKKLDSVGRAQYGAEIKIDEPSGEVLMRGPYVMDGYYKNEELTSKTLVDGWLHTGDKGYLDIDKYLYITGRVSDSFKTSKGEFIEPLTLESYFADIQEIEEICITGLGLAQPIGLVQLSEIGKLTPKDELSEILEAKLADINADLENYKKISTLVIVRDEWTEQNKILGPTLKIKRGNVEEMYSSKYSLWTANNSKIIWE